MTLLAAYNFDETSGSFIDQTGNGHDIPEPGTSLRTTGGHTGGGLQWTGSGNYGTVTAFGITAARTVMAWVQAPPAGGTWAIEWHVDSINSGGWGLRFDGGDAMAWARNDTTRVNPSAAFPTDGLWHHYAATYDGSDVRLFIDGVEAASTPLAGGLRTDTANIRIMEAFDAGGELDDLRIYDEALTAAAITTAMNTPVPTAAVPQVTSSLPVVVGLGGSVRTPNVAALTSRLPVLVGFGGTVRTPTVAKLTSSLPVVVGLSGRVRQPLAPPAPSVGPLAEFWVHTCTVETYEGDGAYGPVYAAARQVACFIDDRRRLVRDDAGDQVVSSTTVYAGLGDAAAFTPESRVTVRGKQRTVASVAARDAGGLDLPEHVEAALV